MKRKLVLKRYLGGIGLVAIVAGASSSMAFRPPKPAGLEFCNRSYRETVKVAVAYPMGQKGWATEGWLELGRGECSIAIPGALKNRYYYYFASTGEDYGWKGDQSFCVSERSFTFMDAEKQCKGVGSRWEQFRELDTGKDASNFTLNLE